MKILDASRFLSLVVGCFLLVQCGVFVGNPADADGDSVDNGATPTDSSGNAADTSLSLTSDASATLNLQDDETLELPNGLEIEYGKVVVGRLRLNNSLTENQFEKDIDSKISEFEAGEDPQKDIDRKEKDDALKEITDDYDAQIAAESDPVVKDQLRDEEDELRLELEREFAGLNTELEDEQDNYEEQNDETLKLPNEYTYDLITGTVSPEIEGFQALDGGYPRIELELRPIRTDEDDRMINRSAVVEGEVEINNVERRVEFEIRVPIKLALKGTKNFQVEQGATNALVVKFSVGAWFVGVDLSTAQVNPRGEIRINDVENKPLYDAIILNIQKSTKFGKDTDGSGGLDTDELLGDGDDEDDEDEEETASFQGHHYKPHSN